MSRCCRGLGYLDDKSLERLSVLFPRLGSVELRLCSVTDDGLVRFCRHNQQEGGLMRIILDHAGDITDTAIMKLADHSPSLQHLSLAHCPIVTNAALRSVYNINSAVIGDLLLSVFNSVCLCVCLSTEIAKNATSFSSLNRIVSVLGVMIHQYSTKRCLRFSIYPQSPQFPPKLKV